MAASFVCMYIDEFEVQSYKARAKRLTQFQAPRSHIGDLELPISDPRSPMRPKITHTEIWAWHLDHLVVGLTMSGAFLR